jgi:hypothetical protein
MDVTAVATAAVSQQQDQLQGALQTQMLRMSADAAASVVKMIEASQQSLANVAPGVGTNLNVSA